jgi:NADPH2:quinone reductase
VKAVQIAELTGPESALRVVDVPEPDGSHMMTPGSGVLVDVHAAGVAFPELLQTRGEYQFKPELPFVPGAEVGGVVRSVSGDAPVSPGDRVAAFCFLGGWAEVAVAPAHFVFPLGELDFAQGAALILNYHTAYFSLVTRGRLSAGETVLIHGAGGGVGTASIQVARGLGARTIAVVSSDEKERVAREAGADEVVRSDGAWKDEARSLTDGRGVDVVLDPVGGDRFTDSLRSLAEGGRVVVVGFTGGSIPEVRVNRLLLNNVEVIGAGWGAYVMAKPDVTRSIGAELSKLIDSGVVRPVVGQRFGLEQAAEALLVLDRRQAVGKVVLDVR